MKVIRGLHNLQTLETASVATIGNFDGLHRGHRHVLQRLQTVAQDHDLPLTVISFEPQPLEFFAPEKAPLRLSRIREKMVFMRRYGVQQLCCLRFDQSFAALSADAFIEQVLVQGLGIRHLIVGDDFRFGHARQGDFATLQKAGKHYGFEVENTPTCLHDDQRISSTRVRQALAQGDMPLAETLLGRPYELIGRVCHGQKLGRELGFPTINLHLGHSPMAASGIFAVRVLGIDNRVLNGVASLGTRPTVNGQDHRLEVYILDFSEQIYGQRVCVQLLHKIRPELKFDSLETLTRQMHVDVEQAQQFFATNPPEKQ